MSGRARPVRTGPDAPDRRILHVLAQGDAPVSQRRIRERAATRTGTFAETLQWFVREGRVPEHQARDWTFIKDVEEGTLIAYALVSWGGDDPADYPKAGWWAEFPDQHLPKLSFRDSVQYAIVDGPELHPSNPPQLPLEGQASYDGQAGGLYVYVPGTDWGENEGARVIDEYEGRIAIMADFARNTPERLHRLRRRSRHPACVFRLLSPRRCRISGK